MKKPLKNEATLPDDVAAHIRALEAGKRNYKRADEILDAISAALKPGQMFSVGRRQFRFVDKFAEKSRINVGMNARRYEFEEVKAAKK